MTFFVWLLLVVVALLGVIIFALYVHLNNISNDNNGLDDDASTRPWQ